MHVGAVIRALGIAAGKMSDSDDDDFPFERLTDTVYPWMLALGCGWEELRASHYGLDELIWQPGELERDGLYGTPDGLLMYTPERNWEAKRTTKKIQPVAGCWNYIKQGLCYSAMNGVRQCQYDVLWVLGDYQRPYQPQATETVVEFSEGEIESWWSIVKKAAVNVRPE